MPSITEKSAMISLVAAPGKMLRWDERTLVHLNHEVCFIKNFIILSVIQEYQSFVKPHRLKGIASGCTIVMLPIILYTDDTSSIKSKQWLMHGALNWLAYQRKQ